jgi:hypothetical protein
MASPKPTELVGAPQFKKSLAINVCPQAVLPKGPPPVETEQITELALIPPTLPKDSIKISKFRTEPRPHKSKLVHRNLTSKDVTELRWRQADICTALETEAI